MDVDEHNARQAAKENIFVKTITIGDVIVLTEQISKQEAEKEFPGVKWGGTENE